MTKLVDSSDPSTELPPFTEPQPNETPQSPVPKPFFRPWAWFLVGTVAIAGIGAGIWYGWLRPQSDNLIPLSGRIEGYETDVSTKGAGRVEEVTVREGAAVTKGQLLVLLDDTELQSELAAAKSQVDAAKQRETAVRLQISVQESQVADSKLNLQQSEGDTTGKVAEAQALVSTAQAVLQQEQARVEEARALLEEAQVDRDRYARLASLSRLQTHSGAGK